MKVISLWSKRVVSEGVLLSWANLKKGPTPPPPRENSNFLNLLSTLPKASDPPLARQSYIFLASPLPPEMFSIRAYLWYIQVLFGGTGFNLVKLQMISKPSALDNFDFTSVYIMQLAYDMFSSAHESYLSSIKSVESLRSAHPMIVYQHPRSQQCFFFLMMKSQKCRIFLKY